MTHVMLDLETYGTSPGSVILTIGACSFGHAGYIPGREFQCNINHASSIAAGMTEDAATKTWWVKQSDAAIDKISPCFGPGSLPVAEALMLLKQWFTELKGSSGSQKLFVWGNGASFDNALLAEVAKRCGFGPLWRYSDDRCYRTLKSLPVARDILFTKPDIPHVALNDAIAQADHAAKILTGIFGLTWNEE